MTAASVLAWLSGVVGLAAVIRFGVAHIARRGRRRPWTLDPSAQRVVILGASSGIGEHLAYRYAARGARLLLVARRQDRLEAVHTRCLSLYPAATEPACSILVGDVTDESVLAKAVRTARLALGGVDTLVLCAGITSLSTFDDLCRMDDTDQIAAAADGPASGGVAVPRTSRTRALIDRIFATNVVAPILSTKYFLSTLRETSSRAQVLVVSSVAGIVPAPTRTLYSSTKHALNGFFGALRIEISRDATDQHHHRHTDGTDACVDVCIVMPGTVDTDLRSTAMDDAPVADAAAPTQTKSVIKKIMTPETCAEHIIRASDRGDRDVYIPSYYWWARLLSVVAPDLVDRLAAKKYNFSR